MPSPPPSPLEPNPFLPEEIGEHAYSVLGQFGAQYDSTMDEVNRSGLAAQTQRAATQPVRDAWKLLRNSESRLALDFFFLQPHEEAFGDHPSQGSRKTRPPPDPLPPALPLRPLPSIQEMFALFPDLPPIPVPEEPEPAQPDFQPDLWRLLDVTSVPLLQPALPLPSPSTFLERPS